MCELERIEQREIVIVKREKNVSGEFSAGKKERIGLEMFEKVVELDFERVRMYDSLPGRFGLIGWLRDKSV